MAESYGFPDGTLYLWTGINPSSAIGFVENILVNATRGYLNQQNVNGGYYNVETGRRVEVSFTTIYVNDMSLFKLFNSPTAVHMKLDHNHDLGSAGVILYSGVFDNFMIQGSEGQVYKTPMAYHANVWSAYG